MSRPNDDEQKRFDGEDLLEAGIGADAFDDYDGMDSEEEDEDMVRRLFYFPTHLWIVQSYMCVYFSFTGNGTSSRIGGCPVLFATLLASHSGKATTRIRASTEGSKVWNIWVETLSLSLSLH